MIWIKVGDKLEEIDVNANIFVLHGTITVNPNVKYMYEKPNPFVANEFFRHGKYYTDNLRISCICDPEKYETLYYMCLAADKYLVAWETVSGYQWRIINEKIPYPSELRFLNGRVEFGVETAPYTEITQMMNKLTHNFKWGQSTIANTVWN